MLNLKKDFDGSLIVYYKELFHSNSYPVIKFEIKLQKIKGVGYHYSIKDCNSDYYFQNYLDVCKNEKEAIFLTAMLLENRLQKLRHEISTGKYNKNNEE